MNKKIKWTGGFDFSNPVPEEEPKKVKYILNTDFGPIKEGTEMLKSEGIYVLTDKRFGLSVSEEYITEVTEFKFGDRVISSCQGGSPLNFVCYQLKQDRCWVLHDGASQPFPVLTKSITPYND